MSLLEIMDALTYTIGNFSIYGNKDSFETDLDVIMKEMNNVSIHNDRNWKILKTNFSKLRYLHETINFYYVPMEGKFIDTLNIFMETIDKKSKEYLEEIKWESEPEYFNEAQQITFFLQESLNKKDPIEKLKNVVKAYTILVPIVEGIRHESSDDLVEPNFIELFEPGTKRKRIN